MTNSATAALIAVGALVLYIVAWPVPIDPVGWEAPTEDGLSGVFETRTTLFPTTMNDNRLPYVPKEDLL